MSFANSDSFISSFSILIILYLFCLIPVARTSNSMLNKSGKSGHHCLIPDLRDGLNFFYNTFCRIIDFSNYVAMYFFKRNAYLEKVTYSIPVASRFFKK